MLRQAEQSYLDHGIGESCSVEGLVYIIKRRSVLGRTAKVWKNFNLTHDLKGHQQSVWAVLAVDEEQYLTG